MNSEGVSSLAVVDNQYNVVGNISTWDVKVSSFHPFAGHYSRESRLAMNRNSC